MRTGAMAVCGLTTLFGACAVIGPSGRVSQIQKEHDALSDLCYQSAGEVIDRKASEVRALYFSPRSAVMGEWEFELFYGKGEPKKWGETSVQTASPSSVKSTDPGSYEVRYTYIPARREVGGRELLFHGVKQEVIELASGQAIARRENYIWGRDFNRSTFCLGADWYSGNERFIERVLGSRYVERTVPIWPERYSKAKLLGIEKTNVNLENYSQISVLPSGFVYDYNRRTISFPGGSFYMLSHRAGQPISYVGTIVEPDRYVFVMLPSGGLHNWPLRQLMLFYRDKQGKALKSHIVQIPPVFDWSNEWGMRPGEFALADGELTFSIFGDKLRLSQQDVPSNAGKYFKKYTFVAPID